MAFAFENLKVWDGAIEVSDEINQLTKTFPKDEMYILTSQIKRAADSVALNIAEGSTGQSKKEFNRFLGIALRSAVEVIGCLFIAKRRGFIDQKQFNEFYPNVEEEVKMIQGFRKSLRKN